MKARNGDESPLFEAGKQYTVTVSAFGYPDLVFSFAKEDETAAADALLEAATSSSLSLPSRKMKISSKTIICTFV